MLSWKTFLLSLAVAGAGAWALVSGGVRLSSLRAEMAQLQEASRTEGESFVKTLQGAHADRQIEALDRRRLLAADAARARRDQMLGVIGLLASALLFVGGTVVRRVLREVAEGQCLTSERPTRAAGR